ncbi:M48 family metalloprotease [Actinospica durhamensis]|uniref:Protease HtpX homolog n=1 Tax=Actinospica durhamensis TaxID=1508375 RepID=A0A941IM41_9ACTN|nr:M48 family metalloprotease [Actinospica durhamensis]
MRGSGLVSSARAKTTVLISVFSLVALGTGELAGGREGLVVAVVVLVVVLGYAYHNADTLPLRTMHAQPIGEAGAPVLYRIVRELSHEARRPMPRIYVSPTESPNAFATGRDPRNASVCCTVGLLRTLDEHELRAVIAHELAHVYNRDVLVSSVAGALAGALVWSASLLWLLPGLGGSEDDEGWADLLVSFLLGPLAAMLVRTAVGRSREFHADASAARLTGDPLSLATALRKLDAGVRAHPLRGGPGPLTGIGHLMIVHPFGGPDGSHGGLRRLCSTHPPVAERIARLEHLAGVRTRVQK